MKAIDKRLMGVRKMSVLLSVTALAFGLGLTGPKSAHAYASEITITGDATVNGAVTLEVKTSAGVLVTGISFTVLSGDTPTITASAASALPLVGAVTGVISSGGNLRIIGTASDLECRICEGTAPCTASDVIPSPPASAAARGQAWTKQTISIPTVSEWGLVVMTLLCMAAGTIMYGRWRRVQAAV